MLLVWWECPLCWISTASMLLLCSAFANRFAWIGLTLCFSKPALVLVPMCSHSVEAEL